MSAPDWRREDATPQKGAERGESELVSESDAKKEVRVRVLAWPSGYSYLILTLSV